MLPNKIKNRNKKLWIIYVTFWCEKANDSTQIRKTAKNRTSYFVYNQDIT